MTNDWNPPVLRHVLSQTLTDSTAFLHSVSEKRVMSAALAERAIKRAVKRARKILLANILAECKC